MTKSKRIKRYIDNGGRIVHLKGEDNPRKFHSWTEKSYELYWTVKGISVFCLFKDIDKNKTIKRIEGGK